MSYGKHSGCGYGAVRFGCHLKNLLASIIQMKPVFAADTTPDKSLMKDSGGGSEINDNREGGGGGERTLRCL